MNNELKNLVKRKMNIEKDYFDTVVNDLIKLNISEVFESNKYKKDKHYMIVKYMTFSFLIFEIIALICVCILNKVTVKSYIMLTFSVIIFSSICVMKEKECAKNKVSINNLIDLHLKDKKYLSNYLKSTELINHSIVKNIYSDENSLNNNEELFYLIDLHETNEFGKIHYLCQDLVSHTTNIEKAGKFSYNLAVKKSKESLNNKILLLPV